MNYTFGGRMAAWPIELQAHRRSHMSGIRRCALGGLVKRRGLVQGLRVGRWSLGMMKCDDGVSCPCRCLGRWSCRREECFGFDFDLSRRSAAVWAVSRASNSRVCSWPRSTPRQTPLIWFCWAHSNNEQTLALWSRCSDANELP
jgi:hypothetical protein